MRLITHNFLQCHAKGCNSGNYPLRLSGVQLETREAEFSIEFLQNIVSRLDWQALVNTARSLGVDSLPDTIPESLDEAFLQNLHKVLLELHIQSGRMQCPNCNHEFPIRDGIPCMLLTDISSSADASQAMETEPTT